MSSIRPRDGWLGWAAVVLVAACVGVAAVGLSPITTWWLDLTRHFVPHLALASVGVALLAAAVGAPRAALVAALLALSLFWRAMGSGPTEGDRSLTVIAYNVEQTAKPAPMTLAWLARQGPALVCTVEVSPSWVRALSSAHGLTPLAAWPRDDFFGAALWTTDPTLSLAGQPVVHDVGRPTMWEVPLHTSRGRLDVLVVHTMPPISAAAAALRDAHLEAVWQWTRDRATPWVICGDVNATPWSQPVRGHRPVVEGTWWTGGTWPSWVPSWAAIPIDHVWVSEELQVRSRVVGPYLGSDHRPVVVAIGDRDAP